MIRKKELKVTVSQTCPKTLENESWKPFHMPIKVGLISKDGGEVNGSLLNDFNSDWKNKGIIHLKDISMEYIFQNVEEKPVLSVNRDFSAPVLLDHEQSLEEELTLLKYDTNAFNRYETAQNLANKVVLDLIKADELGEDLIVPESYLEAFRLLLAMNL